MLKSLWIKLPTLALAGLIIALVDGPQAWWWATAILLLGTLVLLHFVCNVRSSFLVRTLWNAPEATNAVALTFDDGPDPNYTSRVLDSLAKHDVPAAFFVVGHLHQSSCCDSRPRGIVGRLGGKWCLRAPGPATHAPS
mgnify:CR=1 FL=1